MDLGRPKSDSEKNLHTMTSETFGTTSRKPASGASAAPLRLSRVRLLFGRFVIYEKILTSRITRAILKMGIFRTVKDSGRPKSHSGGILVPRGLYARF